MGRLMELIMQVLRRARHLPFQDKLSPLGTY